MSYPPAAAPVLGRERISSIDVLRGVALLGILLMNIVAMGLPHWAYDDPMIAGNRSPADFWTWAVNAVLFEGKMRTIFSMLFGAGIILITTRAEERAGRDAPADIHFRRNMWLVLFGAIHGYLLLWPGDILYMYGLAGMFLFVFRRLRPRNLIILGAVILALQVPKMYGMSRGMSEAREGLARFQTQTSGGAQLSAEDREKQKRWQKRMAEARPPADKVQKEIDDRRGGYLRNLASLAPIVFMLETKMAYAIGIWDVVGMMLIGMAFMKLGVFSAAKSYKYYALMALIGYGYGLTAGTFVVWDWMRNGFAPGTRWLTLYDTTRLAVALGHIAVVMMVCKAGALTWITRPLAAVGQMALTNYIMHSVIVMFVFTGLGFALFGQLSRFQLYYVVGGIWLFQLIASPIWLRYFQFGPLEWLWRSLTYKKMQPMRIRAYVPQPEPAPAIL
jgi:uncharacterized protein